MKKITLAFFFIFFLGKVLYSQDKSVLNLANDDDYSSFSFFDSLSINNYNLFFTGEDHRFPLSNSDLELKMFKYLHKKVGVRVFLIEFGKGMGYFINKYVSEGDTNAKNILKNNLREAYSKLFNNLRSFYTSLPEDEKFSVKSVDLSREPVFAIKFLEDQLPENSENIPDSIKIHIEAIKALSEYYNSQSGYAMSRDEPYGSSWYNGKEHISPYSTVRTIINNFDSQQSAYELFLGNSFTLFKEGIGWLKETIYWESLHSTPQRYLFREAHMEKNVKAMFTANPTLKAYGQFGRCHTQLNRETKECSYYYFNSLATRLNNSTHPQLGGKVFSCPIFYPNTSSFRRDVSINSGLNAMAKKAEKNKIVAFAFDTITYPDQKKLTTRFNALIINNLQRDRAADGTEGKTNPYGGNSNYHVWNERLLIIGEGGIKGYNFSNVNNAFGTSYNNLQQFVGFSFNFAENYGLNVSSIVHWFPTVEDNINDSTSATLRGFAASMRYSKDILKRDKYDLTIGVGYGYERWTSTITEEFSDESRRDILGNSRTTQFTNPAFFMDAGFDFKVHIEWISIGIFSRYQLDFSNRRWRQNGELVRNSPRFSLNAYVVGASIGFNLEY